MTISCAMICWNESKTIDLALKSLEGFADEVIIIDSLSFDGTQDIARNQLKKLNLDGRVEQIKVVCLRDARAASIEACTGDWILILDANQVLSNKLKEVLLNHAAKYKGKVCAFRSLNLMGDYAHYFKNLPYMNWHKAFFEKEAKMSIPPGTIHDRPRFKLKIATTTHWAANLSRVRPAWRSWYRGEPFDDRYWKKGDKNYSLKTSYMDRWSRERKYASIVDFMEAEEDLSLRDVERIAPAWYLDQLQRCAIRLTPEMELGLPEVIKAERQNPRYELLYKDKRIIGRKPSL